MNTTPTMRDWDAHYGGGRDFRPLTGTERSILGEHLALPEGAQDAWALDVACGTGELARFLAGFGYRVVAVDWARSAIERAAASPSQPPSASPSPSPSDGIAYHRLDVTSGDIAALAPDGGYRLITMRRALAHLPDRTRVVAALAALLAPEGVLCVITPHADRHPAGLRAICLDDTEIGLLREGWQRTERFEAGDCAVLLLRAPGPAPSRPPRAAGEQAQTQGGAPAG
ncbi:class I SAM-dependent methyltransferase [Streptomyces subrutilus]|uniref:class I SAM-dependent methyltransferase n=1 Tax=Streptomyces subrutilus TaxID=36818 RepID=UPI0033D0EF49